LSGLKWIVLGNRWGLCKCGLGWAEMDTLCKTICVGVPTRGPGSQLVNVLCFLVPDDDARGNHSNARFILVPAAGPYVQQRECARALYYLAPGVLVVGDTSEAREGGKLPSLC